MTRGEKRKFEDSKCTVAAKRIKKQYTAKEKVDYQKKKARERKVRKEGLVAPAGRVDKQCEPKPTYVLIRKLSINGNLTTNAHDTE